jgi:hypothetical protein
VTTVAALGTLLGIYLFIRGFRRLPRVPLARTIVTPQPALPAARVVTISSRISDELVMNADAEVIRLTPEQSVGASSMSQQSRIAAALHKAGIASAASWNRGTDQSGDDIQSARDAKNLPALQTEKLKVTADQSAPSDRAASVHCEKTKPSTRAGWLLWLGGALALTGAYVLAFHLGLL